MDVTSSCKSPMNTGVQRVVRGFFRALLRAGREVTPLVWDPRLRSYASLSHPERDFLERPFGRASRATSTPGRLANPIPVWSKFSRQLSRRKSRLDLLSTMKENDVFFVPEIFQDNRVDWMSEARAQHSAKTVALFYDAIVWRRPELVSAKRRERFVDYLQALAHFDEVLAISQEAADDLRDCCEVATTVCGLPVDDFALRPAKSRPRKIPSVLCVGTFEPRKNHLRLIDAAEEIWREQGPIFQLTLIGRTTKDFGARVTERIAGNPLIRWQRHVDDASLTAAYDDCAFTVFPSLVEGFGLPIIESLQRGRPCICGSNGSLGELARGGGCLTIEQTDSAELAEAILRLLRDAQLRAELSREAAARSFESWDEFLTRYREVFTGRRAAVFA